MHPWHDMYIDDATVATAFPVIVEIPKGSTTKYELDKETGLVDLAFEGKSERINCE